MSYDVCLVDAETKEPIALNPPHYLEQGTYPAGGDTHAHLNITYNYRDWFIKAFESERGIRTIYGMTARQSIPVLLTALQRLQPDEGLAYPSPAYWEPTEGNAWRAIFNLLILAGQVPNGIWSGD